MASSIFCEPHWNVCTPDGLRLGYVRQRILRGTLSMPLIQCPKNRGRFAAPTTNGIVGCERGTRPPSSSDTGGGGSQKSDTMRGFGTPPPFLKWSVGGFKGVFRCRHTVCAKFFWWYSFGLHIHSFVLVPNAATFDFVPLFEDPRECTGYIAIPPTCGPPRRQG